MLWHPIPSRMAGNRFRFTLQNILDLRAHELEEAKRALGEVERKLEEQQQRLNEAKMNVDRLSTQVSRTTLTALRNFENFRRDAERKVQQETRLLSSIERQRTEALRVLKLRNQAHEALVTLRKAHLEAWQTETNRVEQEQLDEVAMRLHLNKPASDVSS